MRHQGFQVALSFALLSCIPFAEGADAPSGDAGTAPELYAWPDDIGKMPLGIGIWYYNPGLADEVFKDDFLTNDPPFNEAFLKDLAPFKIIRFTDWTKIQFNETATWDQRPRPDVHPRKQEGGVAYEWMIDLCNTLQADFWLAVPHMADEDYMHRLAKLVRDRLDPGLKCYVEYSNETWNSMFGNDGIFAEGSTTGQYTWCVDNGKRLGFSEEEKEAGALYHVYASARLFKAFQDVYGNEMSKRVVKVICGFTEDTSRVKTHLAGLANPKINPEGIMPDAYGLGPYFGHEVDGESPTAFEELRADMLRVAKQSGEIKVLLDAKGIDLVAYEGGQHVLENAIVVNKDQRMYALHCEYLAEMSKVYDVFLFYNNCCREPTFGYFGAKEHTGQPEADAPKWRALRDWAREQGQLR